MNGCGVSLFVRVGLVDERFTSSVSNVSCVRSYAVSSELFVDRVLVGATAVVVSTLVLGELVGGLGELVRGLGASFTSGRVADVGYLLMSLPSSWFTLLRNLRFRRVTRFDP